MSDRDAIGRSRSLLRELSDSDAQLAERGLEQFEKRRRKVLDAQAKEIENAHDDAERQLSNLIGKKQLPALRSALRQEQLNVRNLLQPPKGLDRDRSQLNGARKRKGDAILKNFGVSRDKIKSISARLLKRVPKITLPDGKGGPGFHTRSNLAQWMKLSPLHVAPLPWGVVPTDPGPFSLFKPPFFDWPDFYDFGVGGRRASVSHQHFSHAFAGYVGHDATMIVDGDPFASAGQVPWTRVAFIYEVPADGRLEILVDVTNASGSHDIRTENQWGWSDTEAELINYLAVQVLHPSVPEYFSAEMSKLSNTDEETTLHYVNLLPGEHYFAHFVSSGPVIAGRSVVILVGSGNLENCKCDDVWFRSDTSFHWLIKSVEVRVRP